MAVAQRFAPLLLLLMSAAPGHCVKTKSYIKIIQDRAEVSHANPAPGQPTPAPMVSDDEVCDLGAYMEVRFRPDASTDKLYGMADGFMGFSINAGDEFEYEMMWLDGGRANIDLEGYAYQDWRLRDADIKDQNGLKNHCEHEDLGTRAVGKFYHRRFNMSSAAGKNANNLVFAANPGHGVESKMIVKSIKYLSKLDGKQQVNHIWAGGRKPYSVRSLFNGGVSTHCLNAYKITPNCTCAAAGTAADTSAWKAHAASVANSTGRVPMLLDGDVKCSCNVSVAEGRLKDYVKIEPPRLEMASMGVVIKHPTLAAKLPPLMSVNQTFNNPREIEFITPNTPANLTVTTALPSGLCTTDLVLGIYTNATATVTLYLVDKNSGERIERPLPDMAVQFRCGVPEHGTAGVPTESEEDQKKKKKNKKKNKDKAGAGTAEEEFTGPKRR
eukprot:TRINITY_DN1777_c2_g2_i2.p1 TRINITY_DN1777_c2_g2~~TRINITY_DN1777_c2_g2_i2.p1  ORF type:complete len:457 (+),score=181.87 TRINITY_DN1777_c2_g2_i2:49-1371(+)